MTHDFRGIKITCDKQGFTYLKAGKVWDIVRLHCKRTYNLKYPRRIDYPRLLEIKVEQTATGYRFTYWIWDNYHDLKLEWSFERDAADVDF